MTRPDTLGALKESGWRSRTVKDEMRANLLRKLGSGEPLFPGILGYEDTVVPQIVNAVLARQNFILLGLRGQAKSRIVRQLMLETIVITGLASVAGMSRAAFPPRSPGVWGNRRSPM